MLRLVTRQCNQKPQLPFVRPFTGRRSFGQVPNTYFPLEGPRSKFTWAQKAWIFGLSALGSCAGAIGDRGSGNAHGTSNDILLPALGALGALVSREQIIDPAQVYRRAFDLALDGSSVLQVFRDDAALRDVATCVPDERNPLESPPSALWRTTNAYGRTARLFLRVPDVGKSDTQAAREVISDGLS